MAEISNSCDIRLVVNSSLTSQWEPDATRDKGFFSALRIRLSCLTSECLDGGFVFRCGDLALLKANQKLFLPARHFDYRQLPRI